MYVSFGTDTLFSPALTIYKDIGTLPGWYFSLGLSHSIDVSEGFTLDLAASMGYYISEDDDFVEVDSDLNLTTNKYSGLHDGMISASTTFPMGQYISLTPMVAYSFPLSKKADYLIQSTSFAGDSDFLYGGITFSIAF
jgi:hypothetical protein